MEAPNLVLEEATDFYQIKKKGFGLIISLSTIIMTQPLIFRENDSNRLVTSLNSIIHQQQSKNFDTTVLTK